MSQRGKRILVRAASVGCMIMFLCLEDHGRTFHPDGHRIAFLFWFPISVVIAVIAWHMAEDDFK